MKTGSFPSRHARDFDDFDLFGSLRRRILASIAGGVAWISFTLLYVAFWAHGFSVWQSLAIVLVSLVVLVGLLAGAWVSYGLSFLRGSWD